MRLSTNFTLAELCATSHRSLAEANYTDAEQHLPALRSLCTTLLEPIRAHYGAPVVIHSGFRGLALNTAIGGAKTSQHMLGQAADFHVVGASLEDVWTWIWRDSHLPYGQVLLEGHVRGEPGWIHLSLGEPWRPVARSRQHLVIDNAA